MYPSDLNAEQWKLIEPVLRKRGGRGAPAKHSKQAIFNAVLYVLREGCRWRALPHDFPPWQSVYKHFQSWQRRGVWAEAVQVLNRAWRQRKLGRGRRLPRHAIVDSQSVKSAAEGRGARISRRQKGQGPQPSHWRGQSGHALERARHRGQPPRWPAGLPGHGRSQRRVPFAGELHR